MDNAVTVTLELQAHLNLANAASRPGDIPVDAVQHRLSVQPDSGTVGAASFEDGDASDGAVYEGSLISTRIPTAIIARS